MGFLLLKVRITFRGVILKCRKTMESQIFTHGQLKEGYVSGYANVNGLRLYYEVHGEGAPLVLVHGGGSTIQTTFGRVLPALAQGCQVIAVEMQAHGRTADIDRPLSFEQDADDIAGLLKHLGIDRADVLGFSNGATTTLQFAIRHPEMANKIIVASTFSKRSGAPDWLWEMMGNASFEGMPQVYKDAFLTVNPDSGALRRMYERDVVRGQTFADIPDEQLRAIQAPALIIVGDRDIVRLEHAVEMHGLIPNSRLMVLPSGHGDYLGELNTPLDDGLVFGTLSMMEKFLLEPAMEKP